MVFRIRKLRIALQIFLSLGLACSLSGTGMSASEKPAAPALPTSAESVHALKTGDSIPKVTLTNPDGLAFDLNKVIKNQPTVLIFYRGGWCVYCNRQLSDLRNIETSLQKLGYQIIAVSPDSPEKVREYLEKNKTYYMLLSDSDASAIKAFGLAYQVDPATFDEYKNKFGIDLEAYSGKNHHILPVPAAYVIDQKGKIRFSYVNPDYRVRVNADALLLAAKEAVEKSTKTVSAR